MQRNLGLVWSFLGQNFLYRVGSKSKIFTFTLKINISFFSFREMFESDINVIGNSGANLHINDVSTNILSLIFFYRFPISK